MVSVLTVVSCLVFALLFGSGGHTLVTLFAVGYCLNHLSSVVATFLAAVTKPLGGGGSLKKEAELVLAHSSRGWTFHNGGEAVSSGWEGMLTGTGGQLN